MAKTLVLQSHRSPLPSPWLKECLDSVESWAEYRGFDYQFIGDELFAYLKRDFYEQLSSRTVIATDIARLKAIQDFLAEGYSRVVWADADFLVFNPEQLTLPEENYGLGREIWIQTDNNLNNSNKNKLKAYTQVHNAFMVFHRNNAFLDFYIDRSENLLKQVIANNSLQSVPPQFIGPKLLTALHNATQLPIIESAGMFSPLTIKDIIDGGGPALELMKKKANAPFAGANLCTSMVNSGELTDEEIGAAIKNLLFLKSI